MFRSKNRCLPRVFEESEENEKVFVTLLSLLHRVSSDFEAGHPSNSLILVGIALLFFGTCELYRRCQ